jgi:hypothetical protein
MGMASRRTSMESYMKESTSMESSTVRDALYSKIRLSTWVIGSKARGMALVSSIIPMALSTQDSGSTISKRVNAFTRSPMVQDMKANGIETK